MAVEYIERGIAPQWAGGHIGAGMQQAVEVADIVVARALLQGGRIVDTLVVVVAVGHNAEVEVHGHSASLGAVSRTSASCVGPRDDARRK